MMSDEQTIRHALPLLVTGQAQKDITHNEALALLDLLVNAQVQGVDLNEPPSDPQDGQCWIVGSAPGGAWSGQAAAIAGWTPGGWRFVPAQEGMRARDASSGEDVVRTGGVWQRGVIHAARVMIGGEQVLAARAAPVAAPEGGAAIDTEARACLTAVLAALRHHGLIG